MGLPPIPQLPQSFHAFAAAEALAAAAAPFQGQPSIPSSASALLQQPAIARVTPPTPRSFPIPRGSQSFSIKPEQAPAPLDLASGLAPDASQPALAPAGSAADMTAAAAGPEHNMRDDVTTDMEAQHQGMPVEGDGTAMDGHEGVGGMEGAGDLPQTTASDTAEGPPAKVAKRVIGQSPAVARAHAPQTPSMAAAESAAESYAELE